VIKRRKNLPAELSDEDEAQLGGFLKMLINSTSYGIFAEMNRRELGSGKKERITVNGLDPEPFQTEVSGLEEPGRQGWGHHHRMRDGAWSSPPSSRRRESYCYSRAFPCVDGGGGTADRG
jgi:hypothetical protein